MNVTFQVHPQGNPSIHTPWGMSDYHHQVSDGVDNYSTPKHGGFYVSHEKNAAIPELWRNENGWYEEDCEWAIVCYFYPEGFSLDALPQESWVGNPPDIKETAIASLKAWYWQQWETYHGVTLAPGESWMKDNTLFS